MNHTVKRKRKGARYVEHKTSHNYWEEILKPGFPGLEA